jgi:hypothetical protein
MTSHASEPEPTPRTNSPTPSSTSRQASQLLPPCTRRACADRAVFAPKRTGRG